MMPEHDARYGVELLDALRDLDDVREGMGGANCFQLVALDGDESGGTHVGSAILPKVIAAPLDFIETMIRAELAKIGIQSPENPNGKKT